MAPRTFNSVVSNTLTALNAASNIVSGAASIMAFFGRDPQYWDIIEASFEDVVFHVFETKQNWNGALPRITDKGGRRLAKFLFPYTDGQTTDDLGRKPETFELEVVFFGDNYKEGYQKLFEKLQRPQPGELKHPVRGKVSCKMEDYENIHTSEQNKAMTVRLTMVEHSFSLAKFQTPRAPNILQSFSAAMSNALNAFQNISTAITAVQGSVIFATQLKNTIAQTIATFQSQYTVALQSLQAIFNPNGNVGSSSLLPVNQTGITFSTSNPGPLATTTGANGKITIASQRYTTVISPNDPFANLPLQLLQPTTLQAIAVVTATKQVNDALTTLATVIQAMNESAPVKSLISGTSNTGVKISKDGGFVFSGIDDVGSLEFYDNIQDLRQTGIFLKSVLQTGLQTNKNLIVKFITPRLMTIREVAFANGVTANDVTDIQLMNPDLESNNFIPQGTLVLVPT
jgi:hypothetical protein